MEQLSKASKASVGSGADGADDVRPLASLRPQAPMDGTSQDCTARHKHQERMRKRQQLKTRELKIAGTAFS
jgi:hypothetical protein